MARNYELIKLQNRQSQEGENIEAVKRYQMKNAKKGQPHASQTHHSQDRFRNPNKTRHPYTQTKGKTEKKCGKCGKVHPWGQCPAFGKTCYKCHKVSYFASMCKTRSVHEVHNDLKQEDEEVDYYIGSVKGKPIPPWTTNLQIMGHKIKFKIDTGADVTIINEDTWVRLGKLRVKPALSKLTSTGGDSETIGKLKIEVQQDREIEMFVIKSKSHQSNLLSRSTASEMGLVKFINNMKEYSKVNCEPVKIKIKEDARPYATPVAKRMPIPLMQKVEAELKRMKETGVILRNQ
ncbi:Pol polyprotein [Elysia marginata]|uniref:Pol polyprotein n=1 Tax=Elysia marginata TaxID=1093978 RepID=A0AAV4FTC8_9GAST|nr:Pol polyprotein [Elysia marginata]